MNWTVLICIGLYYTADAMGTSHMRTSISRCILTTFGKETNGTPTFRVCIAMHSPLLLPSMSLLMHFMCQEGACPLKKEDNRNFPFTYASKYDSVDACLHFMFGNLSRVDERCNTGDKKIYCNWHCKDNDFILRAQRLPLYGPLYFPMLYERVRGSRQSRATKKLMISWPNKCTCEYSD